MNELTRRLWAIPRDIWWFLAMLAFLVPARILHTSKITAMFVDGGYYAEVAGHVRDGEGLSSNVSLYHFGYEHFPHPTSVYPLWPWLLGTLARFVDLELLAHWLPLGFSFLAVILAFGFGRRAWPAELFPDTVPGLHAGHLFAFALGFHTEFVMFTSLPYTEGLAWVLVFGFLWRVVVKGADLGPAWAVETGIWLGLLYLTRFQLVVAPLAAAAAYGARFVVGPERPRVVLHAAIALTTFGLFLCGWFLHIRQFVDHAGLGSLLRFDQNRANDLLQPVDVIVETAGPIDFLIDRAKGLIVAWDLISGASYFPSFHTLHYALAVAAPLLAIALFRAFRREGTDGFLARLRSPGNAHWWLILAFAIGGFLSIHVIHKHYYGAWYFTKRQGLLSLPAFVLSLAWLLHQRHALARVVGIVVLSSSLVLGVQAVVVEAAETGGELRGNADRHKLLVDWLQHEADTDGSLVVAIDASLVQRIAWRTKNVGYHWIDKPTTLEDLRTITTRLGATYVVFTTDGAREDDWMIFGEEKEAFREEFTKIRKPPEGYVIYERRE